MSLGFNAIESKTAAVGCDAACSVTTYENTADVIRKPMGVVPGTATGLLFWATEYAVEKLTGSRATRC